MNKRIIYTNAEGNLAVIVPAPDCGLTIDEIAAKDVPNGTPFSIVDIADIPQDRVFRNAWEQVGVTVMENIVKSKLIAHDKRREARSKEMAPLDIDATIPAKAAQAEAARQVIRNKYAQKQIDIDNAANIVALKNIVAAF